MAAIPVNIKAPRGRTPEATDGWEASSLTARRRGSVLQFVVPADACAVAMALALGSLAAPQGPQAAATVAILAYTPVFLLTMAAYGLYRRGRRRLVSSSYPDLGRLTHSALLAVLLVLIGSPIVSRITDLQKPAIPALALSGTLVVGLTPIARMLARIVARSVRVSRVLVLGSGIVASNVLRRVASTPGLTIVGCVDDNELEDRAGMPLLGGMKDILRIVREYDVDHVVVAFTPVNESKVADLLRALADRVQISTVPRMFDILTVRSCVEDLAGLPVVDVAPAALGPSARLTKRLMDVLISGLGLLLLSPAIAIIALTIKATSPGPVFFRQERAGRKGRTFRIWKFRTMRVGSDAQRTLLAGRNEVDGPLFKIRNDQRITSVGRFLRRTSLDEIPQLINVLVGDMSLVGPRPFVLSESSEIGGWAARRYDVRPGMTGLWQISGRNDLPFEELRRLDYSYVASWSLGWDLRILWHTPASVLAQRGAY